MKVFLIIATVVILLICFATLGIPAMLVVIGLAIALDNHGN